MKRFWLYLCVSLLLGIPVMYEAVAQAQVTHFIANACDAIIAEPGDCLGLPNCTEADKGDTVKLTATSLCFPVFDPLTGELLSGDGIAIVAEEVTFDLNGFSIVSASDVAADGEAVGLDVENAGVSVGARNVVVTNSSVTCSVVDNFTANFDYAKGSDGSRLKGSVGSCDHDANSLTPALPYNLVGFRAHGGGVMAIDRTQGITIDTVALVDDPASANGDNGIDWKRCNGPTGTVKNSRIEGPLAGIRLRNCPSGGLTIIGSYISGHAGSGIEITRDVKGATIGTLLSPNTIVDNAVNGIAVGGTKVEEIAITGTPVNSGTALGSIQGNVCGVEIRPTAKNISVNGVLFSPVSAAVCLP